MPMENSLATAVQQMALLRQFGGIIETRRKLDALKPSKMKKSG